ncbi:MAG: fibronectin type III domain-containing protein [Nitrospirae bacterium]|nr:fibronectin type III domain-containing protein [Nitrospirota bacterium]
MGCGSGGSGNNGNEGSKSTADNTGGSSVTIVDSVTLSWDASTTNSDGSPLTDLAGYKVHYGVSSNNYTQTVDVGNFTGAVINNLSHGPWCFSVTAYDNSGNESGYSSEFCTTIG